MSATPQIQSLSADDACNKEVIVENRQDLGLYPKWQDRRLHIEAQLYHGDCFEVLAALPDHSVHALISDPPYGTTALPWDRPIDWPAFWSAITRVCTEEAVIVLFAAQPFATDLINSNRRHFRYELIWHKNRAVGWLDAKRRPLRAHENILVFAKYPRQSTYTPQMEWGHKPYKAKSNPGSSGASHYKTNRQSRASSPHGERYPRSVLTFASRSEPCQHPTQKPLALMEWLVRTYSHEGDVVLDPFMGSGTTGVACLNTGRRFIGVEQDQNYFATARERIYQPVSSLQ